MKYIKFIYNIHTHAHPLIQVGLEGFTPENI